MGGLFGAFAVLVALLQREKDGKGHVLRTGLFENCLFLVAQHMVQFDIEGREAPPMPEREFSWPVYDIFDTSDGKQMFIGAVTEGQWVTLCDILGLQALLDDPDLQTRMKQIDARDRTIPVVATAVRTRSFADLLEAFEQGHEHVGLSHGEPPNRSGNTRVPLRIWPAPGFPSIFLFSTTYTVVV